MTSSTTKCALVGSSTPQLPDCVLSLLTVCFSGIAIGSDGEAALSEQIANLLQDKVMAVEELKLLYIYRFGFSIHDALLFLGVHLDLTDYFDQQKRFYMHDGCLSSISSNATTSVDTSTENAPVCTKCGYDGDDETASNAGSDSSYEQESEHTTVPVAVPWKELGARITAALRSAGNEEAEDTSTPVPVPWEVVGARLGAALRASCDEEFDDTPAHAVVPWMLVGTRIGAALASANADVDDTPVPVPWMEVGARIGVALRAAGNEEVDDVLAPAVAVPWKLVGARIGAALRAVGKEAEQEVDSSALVALPWGVVGARVGAALRAATTEEDAIPAPIAVPWKIVGARVAAALRAAADEEVEVDGTPARAAISRGAAGACIGSPLCAVGIEDANNTRAHAALAWRVVGARVGAAFRAAAKEVDDTPGPFPIPWKVVGARISAALRVADDDEVDAWCKNSATCRGDEHISFAETESTADSENCLFDADSDSDCIASRVC